MKTTWSNIADNKATATTERLYPYAHSVYVAACSNKDAGKIVDVQQLLWNSPSCLVGLWFTGSSFWRTYCFLCIVYVRHTDYKAQRGSWGCTESELSRLWVTVWHWDIWYHDDMVEWGMVGNKFILSLAEAPPTSSVDWIHKFKEENTLRPWIQPWTINNVIKLLDSCCWSWWSCHILLSSSWRPGDIVGVEYSPLKILAYLDYQSRNQWRRCSWHYIPLTVVVPKRCCFLRVTPCSRSPGRLSDTISLPQELHRQKFLPQKGSPASRRIAYCARKSPAISPFLKGTKCSCSNANLPAGGLVACI
jgi:hypothetical protein